MAPPLKAFFDRRVVERIAYELGAAWPGFPRARFVRESLDGLDALELLDRGRHVARALARALPASFDRAVEIVVASLPPVGVRAEHAHPMEPFTYLPHTIWVVDRGLDPFEATFEPAMRAQHALTQRFTAEFSIRPFLERHPEATLARLEAWAHDESPHVRRLVSEGTRPRLPWAPRLRAFQRDPGPVLRLLERLKDDPSEYVRRSVANNLNDVAKDHPTLVLETCGRWSEGASAERRALVRHALRTLVKRREPRALELVGAGEPARVSLGRVRATPRRVPIGSAAAIEIDLTSTAARAQTLRVDLVVHFVKARGTSPKVFVVRQLDLAARASVSLRKSISLAEHTTRTPYPGRHRVDVVVNGAVAGETWFDVLRTPA